jgi:hypothetical protein
MPLTATELAPIITRLLRAYRAERRRLDVIHAYLRNKVCDIYVPKEANAEYKLLVDQARFNVMPLVVTAVAQNLFVDGYRPTGENGRAPSRDNSPIWDAVWQPNQMDARQGAIYRAAIKYGYSYAVVVPGKPVPVITPYSPRRLTAVYDDPVNDEWPTYAMVCHRRPMKQEEASTGSDPLADPQVAHGVKLTIYDAEHRYQVIKTAEGWNLDGEAERHGLGVVPVVRFLDEVEDDDDDDDDVVSRGKVEPLLPAQRQLNQTTFGLLMAQQYAAFKQRWATGMAIEKDETGNPRQPWNSRVNGVWQNESPDGRFGEFSETDLGGYLNSRDKTLLYIASMAQIPPHNLLIGAGISNISADALAALESGHRQDIDAHQTSFGESIEQLLRLAGRAMGDADGRAAWEDTSAQVVWRDTTPRSLAQIADALGKLATQLAIPVQALWERIPGVTDQDIARWQDMASEADLMDELKTVVNQAAGNQQPDDDRGEGEETGAGPAGNGADALASA